MWETEWGAKSVSSHGSTHSRGVHLEKTIADKHGRFVIAETVIDGKKFVFMNIYAPNEPTRHVQFLREISNSHLKKYANDNIILGGDINCVISSIDKRGGRPANKRIAKVN